MDNKKLNEEIFAEDVANIFIPEENEKIKEIFKNKLIEGYNL